MKTKATDLAGSALKKDNAELRHRIASRAYYTSVCVYTFCC